MTDSEGVGPSLSGSSTDDIRRQNLRHVLRLAHLSGPLSRSELAHATGLNRSTIGGLVTELHRRGLIEEHDAVRTRRVGRPGRHVVASERTLAIAVNPEVDAIDVALISLGGRIVRRARHKNERLPSVQQFVNVVEALVAGMVPAEEDIRLEGIGVAVPGLVRESDGRVLLAPHLGWRDEPVSDQLRAATGLPVTAANDANCGVLAESAGGAAGVVVYLNGGASGVGSGIAINGEMLRGHGGLAGEFGHILVNSGGIRCHCGARGCFETEVRRQLLVGIDGLTEKQALDVFGITYMLRQHPGGDLAHEIQRQADYLAIAIRIIVNALNPSKIVFGGHLALLLSSVGVPRMKALIGQTLPGAIDDVDLVVSELGDEVLLRGAAELVFAPLLHDPTITCATF